MIKNSFQDILQRLKLQMNARTDAEVARSLKVTPQSLAAFKKQGRFPGGLLIDYCSANDIPLDWLLYEQGRMYKQQVRGWKYKPKSPTDAITYIKRHLSLSTKVVLIIEYDDYLEGVAHGFVWGDKSMDGYVTRSGVKDDRRNALVNIYERLQNSKIFFYKLQLAKEAIVNIQDESLPAIFEKYSPSETFMGMELTMLEIEETGKPWASRAKGRGPMPTWEAASRKMQIDDIRPNVENMLKNHKQYHNLAENISQLLFIFGELASGMNKKKGK